MTSFASSPWALRARAALLFGGLGAATAMARGGAPASDIGSLATALGAATAAVARPEDVRWEPSRGALEDYILGRFAIFLASGSAGGPRDVYRARVRLSPEGHPVAVADVHNLTATPLGDDHALVVSGTRAAFATLAYGQEQSVTALDLAGEGSQNTTETLADRAMAGVTNLQQTGTPAGVARVDLSFDAPARRVGLAIGDGALAIELGDDVGVRRATLDLARGELAAPLPGLHTEASRHLPKRPIFWAVDTVRAVPWIGPAPIAWLEERVFALKDAAKQTAFKFHGEDAADTLAAPSAVPPEVIGATAAAMEDGAWPPRNIATIWKTAEAGEGEWKPVAKPWMRKFPTPAGAPEAPSPFVSTFVRPDEARPYAHVMLVEMDMRQLDLEMEAGIEDPKPLTGQHGPGRLPRDPKVLSRVVAAFNGAFKTEHGFYGMMVHKRVLLPPQPFAATVVLTDDGRAGFGSWGATQEIGGLIEGATPIEGASLASFRQNLDPLIDRGEVNPTGRALWGYTLPGNGMQTERTGLCVTFAGHLIYAWGDDASATSIGRAMKLAGCDYGMHLDMNPHHTGFIFTTINQIKGHDYHSELLTPLMEVSTDRYIEYAPKDFFYMLLRDPTPTLGEIAWLPDGGTQPPPAWSPGVWRGRSGDVDVTLFEQGRAGFRIAAGTGEPDARTGAQPQHALGDDDKKRVLSSITLGTASDKRALGLSTSGKRLLADTGDADMAVLVARASDTLAIAIAGEPIDGAADVDSVELPLLADKGAVRESAERALVTHGKDAPALRGALGVTASGRVMVATADASPAHLATALVKAGCLRVVLLDRGAMATTTVRRSGTQAPPVAESTETTLFALGRPMRPRGFKFTARGAKK